MLDEARKKCWGKLRVLFTDKDNRLKKNARTAAIHGATDSICGDKKCDMRIYGVHYAEVDQLSCVD